MQKEYMLMLEDKPVMYFHMDDMETKLLNRSFLPFFLREKITEPNISNVKEYYKENARNISLIKEYASSRILSLSRENAKQIFAACNVSQDNSIENRSAICFLCKGVSVNDSYWFKNPESDEKWESVNPKHNHLSEIIDIALAGESPTFTANPICPELTTKGLFKKAWIRENNDLYLLKSDKTANFINTKMEILTSKILDCTDIPHVKYEEAIYKNMIVAKSKNFVPDQMSFVEAHEVMSYYKDRQKDFKTEIMQKFEKDFSNMAVIDYIIQNTDRHDQNYGFFMNNETGELECMAPLFDHNQALIADVFEKDVTDTMSQMLGTKETIKEIYNDFSSSSKIFFDCSKWQKLKESIPEYKKVLERVEKRIVSVRCIEKTVTPRHELPFSDMLKDLEKQCKMAGKEEKELEKELEKER